MLVYNDFILQVLNMVPLAQCLSNLYLKTEEYLAICKITSNDGS